MTLLISFILCNDAPGNLLPNQAEYQHLDPPDSHLVVLPCSHLESQVPNHQNNQSCDPQDNQVEYHLLNRQNNPQNNRHKYLVAIPVPNHPRIHPEFLRHILQDNLLVNHPINHHVNLFRTRQQDHQDARRLNHHGNLADNPAHDHRCILHQDPLVNRQNNPANNQALNHQDVPHYVHPLNLHHVLHVNLVNNLLFNHLVSPLHIHHHYHRGNLQGNPVLSQLLARPCILQGNL